MATSRSSCFGVVQLHVELGGGNQKHLLGVGPKGCVLQRGAGEQMDGGLEELLLRRGALHVELGCAQLQSGLAVSLRRGS